MTDRRQVTAVEVTQISDTGVPCSPSRYYANNDALDVVYVNNGNNVKVQRWRADDGYWYIEALFPADRVIVRFDYD